MNKTRDVAQRVSKRYAHADGYFGPFRWLGDTDNHGKWYPMTSYLRLVATQAGWVSLMTSKFQQSSFGFRDIDDVLATSADW